MLFKSRGIIFKSIKYSESSLILDIFTEERGVQSFIISGVRKARSKSQSGIYQTMNIVDLVAYQKENNKISRIKECKLALPYQNINFDVIRSSICMFIIDISRRSIRERAEQKELFQFVYQWLVYLDRTDDPIANMHLHYMLDLAQYLGFEIQNNYGTNYRFFNLKDGAFAEYEDADLSINETLSETLYLLLKTNKAERNQLRIAADQRSKLLDQLIKYYQYHVDGFGSLKSLEIFRTVLA